MKIHQKAYLLVALSLVDYCWDQVLIAQAFAEYGLSGHYQETTLRIALDELNAAGLINRIDEKIDTTRGKAALQFCFQLCEFGRRRMQDTGLL